MKMTFLQPTVLIISVQSLLVEETEIFLFKLPQFHCDFWIDLI